MGLNAIWKAGLRDSGGSRLPQEASLSSGLGANGPKAAGVSVGLAYGPRSARPWAGPHSGRTRAPAPPHLCMRLQLIFPFLWLARPRC